MRGRLPIGKKFSISAGAAFRTHERVYGVNPYEIWVSALDADGNQENYWYELAYEYGYQDAFYTTTILNPVTGQEQNIGGYFWWDPEGRRIASSDLQFRDGPYKQLISRYTIATFKINARTGRGFFLDFFFLIVKPIIKSDVNKPNNA